jgi:hypothetical protein
LINNAPSGVTVTTSNNVGHALSSWNAQNYTNVQTYAFSPIADTGLYTTGTGTSTTGLCAMLSGAAATACASSTTYAVSYNTSNHTGSSPAVTSDSRPSLSPDVGVYQGVPGETSTCANPVISPASGAYSSPQTISMSDSTGGCTIYYTTNDTTPNCSSTSYSGPFSQPIVTSTYVEAIGCESGYTNSGVTTNTYTLAPISTTPGIAQGAAFTELFIDRNFLQGN